MHFPKYWAKGAWSGADSAGRFITRESWGWSDVSEADARARAQQRAQQMAALPPALEAPRNDYPYPRSPLREPVLRTLPSPTPDVRAVVTRNGYGCEVLNTDRVAFIDVDLPAPPRRSLLASLFGGKRQGEEERIGQEAAKISLLEQWQRRHPALAFRVYRTAAGLRYLLTSALAAPTDTIVEDAFEHLEVDPDYQRLCRQQNSFRARLTPKPWRCGAGRPPHRFPFTTVAQAERSAAWLKAYEPISRRHAVCMHLLTIGTADTAPTISAVLTEHDRVTGVGSILPLA